MLSHSRGVEIFFQANDSLDSLARGLSGRRHLEAYVLLLLTAMIGYGGSNTSAAVPVNRFEGTR